MRELNRLYLNELLSALNFSFSIILCRDVHKLIVEYSACDRRLMILPVLLRIKVLSRCVAIRK